MMLSSLEVIAFCQARATEAPAETRPGRPRRTWINGRQYAQVTRL